MNQLKKYLQGAASPSKRHTSSKLSEKLKHLKHHDVWIHLHWDLPRRETSSIHREMTRRGEGEGCRTRINLEKEGPDRTDYPTNDPANGREDATEGPAHS